MADPETIRPPRPPAPEPGRADASVSPNQKAWRKFRRNPAALGAALLLLASVFLLLVAPWFQSEALANRLPRALTWSPLTLTDQQFAPPGADHWFGTDVHGRDVLSRVIAGARISLVVGMLGAGISVVIGVSWGALAGYLGGRWDGWMMRLVDALYAMPTIVLVVVLVATLQAPLKALLIDRWGADLGPAANLLLLFAGLGAVSWLTMARIVRGQVLSLRERNYIAASRVLGASHLRILLRHVLPNAGGTGQVS